MRKGRVSLTVTAIAAGAMGASAANAAPVAGFDLTTYATPGGIQTPVTSYVTIAGVSLTIPVYLYATDAAAVSMIDNDGGLVSGGFSVTQTTGTGAITGVAGSGDGANGNSFGSGAEYEVDTPGSNDSTHVQLSQDNAGAPPPEPDANNDVEIGAITITSASTGTYTFTLSSYGAGTPTFYDTVTVDNGYDLDLTNDSGNLDGGPTGTYVGTSANPETFTVTVVPEPATLGLVSLGSLGFLARRRRRFQSGPLT